MSIQIIEGKQEHMVEFSLNFYVDRSGGFSFPCDENGNVFEDMNPAAKENFEYCKQHPEKFYRPAYIEKREYDFRNPNVGICHCGEKFEMFNQYLGACQCPECGQWYNLWGQELVPPDQWEEDR